MEKQLELRERSPVVSATGEKLGEVERFVVEPVARTLTHVVVLRRGLLSRSEFLVPFAHVEEATGTVVSLRSRLTARDLEPFDASATLPAAASGETIPASAVVVSAGDEVVSAGDRSIGTLSHVFTDDAGLVRTIVLELKGSSLPHLVDADVVESFTPGRVRLAVDASATPPGTGPA